MEILQLSLIALIFVTVAVLMFFRILPALLALPLMAFFIPLVSGVGINDILQFVIGVGSTKLAEAYTIAFFGSMLSVQLQKTGVAERLIKIGAELSGDKPLMIAMMMLLLICLLFTTLGGLGAIIMVSTVTLPILASIGLSPAGIAGIFLFGLSLGGIMNVGNWAIYTNVLHLSVDEVRGFASVMFGISFLGAVLYVIVQMYRDGIEIGRKSLLKFILSIAVLLGLLLSYFIMPDPQVRSYLSRMLAIGAAVIKSLILSGVAALTLWSFVRIVLGRKGIWWGSYFTPLIPLFLILFSGMNFIAAFIIGLIYGAISTYQDNTFSTFLRSILDGGGVVMPAVVLMIGIGMLLHAMIGPPVIPPQYADGWPVLKLLKPVMLAILPTGALSYILLFSLCAPMALYRGPLNVWGMGYGLATIFLVGGLHPGAIMGVLMAVGQIQGISDPTNTQNVWLANEVRIDVQKILWNTIPFTWLIAIAGLILSAVRFL